MKIIVAQQHERFNDQLEVMSNVQQLQHQQASQTADALKSTLPTLSKRSMNFSSEMVASNWLTSLPTEEDGFCLHKGGSFNY